MNVLFLCTGNSCRSQMAEGWAKYLDLPDICAYSAGIVAKGLDPRASMVMNEVGVDISSQQSKTVNELPNIAFDLVITLCDNAHETCPVFPLANRVVHHTFDDPPLLANHLSSEEALEQYRRVRDEIKAYVRELPQLTEQKTDDAR